MSKVAIVQFKASTIKEQNLKKILDYIENGNYWHVLLDTDG